ncbi:MAG: hypothetical protein ACOX34_05015 [Bacillota bacterium]|nr:hypothetical protein [Candidatus Fermentithermobacillaceae bacterium]
MNDVLALLFMIVLVLGLSTKSAQVTTKPAEDADPEDLCCCIPKSEDYHDQ